MAAKVRQGRKMMGLWRIFFAFAGAFNLVVGAVMLGGAEQVAPAMGVSGPAAGYIVALAGLLIAVFGLGYVVVGWRPLPNRNIVVIGAIGKAGAAVLASLAHQIPHSVYLFAMSDLVFALAFAVFLARTRNAPTP